MHWSAILRDLGSFVLVPSFLCLPACAAGALAGEWNLLPGFAVAGVVSAGLGSWLRRRPEAARSEHSLADSMLTVATAWLSIGLIASLPFVYWGRVAETASAVAAPFGDFWTALFEAMSGITSTGLTMASDASQLPRSIQIWRTLLEWVGGVGVVVLALAVIRPAEASGQLFAAEGRDDRIAPTFRGTAQRIWWLYGALTLLAVGLFLATGMPWWQALNHGMTGIATGGFTVTRDSFAGYGPAPRIAAMLIMLLGAMSFRIYGRVFMEREWKAPLRDLPCAVLLGSTIGGVLLLLLIDGSGGDATGPLAIAFQWVSALGTCGFQSSDLTAWAAPSVVLLTAAMFVGGASGSTTGGVKVDRAVLAVLGPVWHIRQRISRRHGVQYYRIDGERVQESDALRRYRGAAVLASLFFATILVATLVLMTTLEPGHPPLHVLFDVASALSNVGLSTGVTDVSMGSLPKITLILVMWMGRLEITSALVLIGLPLVLAEQRRGSDDA